MSNVKLPSVVSALVVVALSALPVHAADRQYLASWTITSSSPAPWVAPDEKPVQSDLAALMGKTVTFGARRIVAPRPLGCARPLYAMKAYAPDRLFQGGLTEPVKQANALGFTGRTIPTLETGCDGAIDFHFASLIRGAFALNNRIYTIEKRSRRQ